MAMLVDIDGILIRVEPSSDSPDDILAVDLWSEKSLAEMPVPDVVAVCKATQKVREILRGSGFRVVRMLGELILPGE